MQVTICLLSNFQGRSNQLTWTVLSCRSQKKRKTKRKWTLARRHCNIAKMSQSLQFVQWIGPRRSRMSHSLKKKSSWVNWSSMSCVTSNWEICFVIRCDNKGAWFKIIYDDIYQNAQEGSTFYVPFTISPTFDEYSTTTISLLLFRERSKKQLGRPQILLRD